MNNTQLRLTAFSHGAGWACKIGPQDLAQVLRYLPKITDPAVLVARDTDDDAAVYRLSEDLALVQTVDFITPVVDDPYTFGAVAAANALSDVYAMGGRPLFALNIVAFPVQSLPLSVLGEILRGGADKAAEAGIAVIGGHSIDDHEPKYGMCVTGLVHPDRIVTNARARPGDLLFLTKPLGVGIITTGIDRRAVGPQTVERVVAVMTQLNRAAAAAMVAVGAHAATDVTGFGLLGHLREMTTASQAGARIHLPQVPVLEEAWALATQGVVPEGSRHNLRSLEGRVFWDGISPEAQIVLADAQTSGGLLIAVAPEKAERLRRALDEAGVVAAQIGEVIEDEAGRIWVVP